MGLHGKYCNFPISSDVTGHRLAVRTKYFECHRSQWSCLNWSQMSQGSPREHHSVTIALLLFPFSFIPTSADSLSLSPPVELPFSIFIFSIRTFWYTCFSFTSCTALYISSI